MLGAKTGIVGVILVVSASAFAGDKRQRAATEKTGATLGRIAQAINPGLEYHRKDGGDSSNSVYQRIRWSAARKMMNLQNAMQTNAK